jgi:RNA polymerase sigma-70 factor, ECF subfamily
VLRESTESRQDRASERAAVDAALMARIAAGEREEPLIELYERYGTHLYRFGRRRLGDGNDAEELVQETFVRLWRAAGRFDPGRSSVRSFVYMLAERVAVDLHRRAAARPAAAALDPATAPPEPADGAEQERTLLGLEVREALDALDDRHREVLELGYRGELTQSEIADRLDVPLGTVKSRTYHALRALRRELALRGLDG